MRGYSRDEKMMRGYSRHEKMRMRVIVDMRR